MSPAVIDTNVLLVANGSHPDTSAQCRMACVSRLLAHQQAGVVVIDDAYREYWVNIRTRPDRINPRGWVMRS